jgi:hypothetical protein
MKTALTSPDSGQNPAQKLLHALEVFITKIPTSEEHKNKNPHKKANAIVITAASKSALISSTLAIPPGPTGLLTIIPDLIAIWKVQAQMVADIAGVFGKSASLTQEQMIYCIFKHTAAHVVGELVSRVGERLLVRRASLRVIQRVLQKIAPRITQRVIGSTVSRWIPIIGPLAIGGYAYYDTAQAGKTAIEFFESDIVIESVSVEKTPKIKRAVMKKTAKKKAPKKKDKGE